MGVSKNNGTPKSSILIGFSIIFTSHFWGKNPLFLVQHPYVSKSLYISTSCQRERLRGEVIKSSSSQKETSISYSNHRNFQGRNCWLRFRVPGTYLKNKKGLQKLWKPIWCPCAKKRNQRWCQMPSKKRVLKCPQIDLKRDAEMRGKKSYDLVDLPIGRSPLGFLAT